MIELKPEDIHISLYNTERKGSWDTSPYEKGVTVIHLPTGTKVSVDSHKSKHKNRNEAMTILRDLLTSFCIGDSVFSSYGEVIIFDEIGGDTYVVKGYPYYIYGDLIGHTKEGCVYKNMQALKEKLSVLEQDYYHDRGVIMEEIKALEEL